MVIRFELVSRRWIQELLFDLGVYRELLTDLLCDTTLVGLLRVSAMRPASEAPRVRVLATPFGDDRYDPARCAITINLSEAYMENPTTTPESLNTTTGATRPAMGQRTMVTALFKDRAAAERGYQVVTARGYGDADVNLVMSDATREKYSESTASTELGTKAAKGAGIGGAIGGTVGAIAAAVAAIGTSLVIPGLGLVVAGPLAAALAGAGAGSATGGLLGALIGAGIPEERVKHYEQGIKEGGTLLGVQPRSEEDASYFEREWSKAGAEHVYR